MNVRVVPTLTSALRKVTKRLENGPEDREIRGQVETILTTALLSSARILRKVLGSCYHSKSSGRLLVNAGVKNSEKYNNDNDSNNEQIHGLCL